MANHTVNPGDTVIFSGPAAVPLHPTPSDIWKFLFDRGWNESSPNHTPDDVWHHRAKGRNFMTWEQAVAIEFYEFITLGGR